MTGSTTERASQTYEAISLQFYDGVAPLVGELGRAMSVALDQGHAAVCVVTESTRRMLEEQLTKRGIDVATARNRGQYCYLDGVQMLSEIAPQNDVDPDRFAEVIGGPVERLTKDYRSVWMYGELAALMWGRGNQKGAIELDKLWASFADTHPVVLCVAFPVEAMSWPIVVEALKKSVTDQVRALANGSSIALAVHRGTQKR